METNISLSVSKTSSTSNSTQRSKTHTRNTTSGTTSDYSHIFQTLLAHQIPFVTQSAVNLLGGKVKKTQLQVLLDRWIQNKKIHSKTYHNGKTVVYYPKWDHKSMTDDQEHVQEMSMSPGTKNDKSEVFYHKGTSNQKRAFSNSPEKEKFSDQDEHHSKASSLESLLSQEKEMSKKHLSRQKIFEQMQTERSKISCMSSFRQLEERIQDAERKICEAKERIDTLKQHSGTLSSTEDIEKAVNRYANMRSLWVERRSMVVDAIHSIAGDMRSSSEVITEFGIETDESAGVSLSKFPVNF